MANTFTVSDVNNLHEQFKKAVYSRGSNVSEAISAYMQSEIDGTQAEFNKLKDTVNDLVNRLSAMEGPEAKNEKWHDGE